ncbi:MAG TPA: sugar ABC transporter substrate-binding protein, partial [Roseiarcus sp.]
MRVHVYDQLMAMQASRRQILKGGAAAALVAGSPFGFASAPAYAADSVVAQIMKIPGAGNGSPTDADWQKVGELCLGPTKTYVQPGEFKGV